jgi:hypothetical protein
MGINQLQPGQDPRLFLRRHKERGPKKYIYTIQAVAKVFGVTVRSIQLWQKAGKLDVSNLQSLFEFWQKRRCASELSVAQDSPRVAEPC